MVPAGTMTKPSGQRIALKATSDSNSECTHQNKYYSTVLPQNVKNPKFLKMVIGVTNTQKHIHT